MEGTQIDIGEVNVGDQIRASIYRGADPPESVVGPVFRITEGEFPGTLAVFVTDQNGEVRRLGGVPGQVNRVITFYRLKKAAAAVGARRRRKTRRRRTRTNVARK